MTTSSVRWELWKDGKEIFIKRGSIKSSIRGFKSGIYDNYYIDFDIITSDPLQAKNVVEQLTYKINDIKTKQRIDYLGFLEKRIKGTIGALQASLAISVMTGIPHIIIRLSKELDFDRIKIPNRSSLTRNSQLSGLNVVLITDHITTGNEIIKSVDTIRNNGGTVSDVITYTVRLDKLNHKKFEDRNLELHSIYKIPDDIPFEYIEKIEGNKLSINI
ncbi:MAG: hypothetical protein K8R25_11835 [Methanosarcinales archaeon]|nr:hypothetical protein [Methanosarcinales archaeon]